MPGVVHHHVLLAVCAVMAGGWALRLVRDAEPAATGAPVSNTQVPGGLALGAWAAAGLWLSPETTPFSLLAMGALWAAWVAAPRQSAAARRLADALVACGAAFAALILAAWLADPPAAGYAAVEPDRISLPFVLLAADTLLIALVARRTGRLVATLACGGATAVLWLTSFPQMARGTEGLMSAEEAAAFFHGISEMQPVQGLGEAMETLTGGLLAFFALLAVAMRRPGLVTIYAVGAIAGLVVLAAAHVRFAAYPAVAGAVILPMALAWISRSRMPAPLQSAARMGLILPLLMAPILVPMAAKARPNASLFMPCAIEGAAALLRDHPGAIVLAGVNETPDLLYRTGILTVGSLYHRNPQGFMRLRAAWRSVPGDVPSPALSATGAGLVLACPGEPRSSIVEDLPHDTLLDRLAANDPPRWLHRVADAGPGGFVLYAVTK